MSKGDLWTLSFVCGHDDDILEMEPLLMYETCIGISGVIGQLVVEKQL